MRPEARALQIVAAALTAGPLLMLGVALFLRSQPDFAPEEPATEYLTPLAAAVALAAVAAHFPLGARLKGDFGKVRAGVITRLAVTEAAALIAAVAYLLEGQPASAVAAVVLVGWMAVMQFPTAARLDFWLTD